MSDNKVEELPNNADKLNELAAIPLDIAKVEDENVEDEKQQIQIHIDHFGIHHTIKHPLVMVIGVSEYLFPWPKLSGVQHDVTTMKQLWQNTLGFNTIILTEYDDEKYKRCTDTNIEDFLFQCKSMIKQESKKPYDGLICIISGHGMEDSFISSNGKQMNLNHTFFAPFNATKVKELGNYPKLYLLDVCRGKAPPQIIEQRKKIKGIYDENSFMSINVESDYRVSYAQTPGKYVPANDDGGLFIQPFYKTMMYLYDKRLLHKTDFQTILRMSSQKAKCNNSNAICPVHEDCTDYRLFIECNYEQQEMNEDLTELPLIEYSRSYSDFLERKDTEDRLRAEELEKQKKKKKKKKRRKKRKQENECIKECRECNCCVIL